VNQVELGRVGYGCASLMARTSRADSVRLMHIAFDAGITHFDAARSYGYGQVESALGDFLHERRHAVTVTTKVGILPPAPSRRLTALRAVARRIAPLSGSLRALMRQRAGRLVAPGNFSAGAMRTSFETSLRELRTDYVDVLLLHDPTAGDLTPGALAFLAACRAEGTARAVGIAAGRDVLDALGNAPSDWGTVVQTPDSVLTPRLASGLAPHVITHSVMSRDGRRLHAHLSRHGLLPAWSATVGTDLLRWDAFARYLLAAAFRRNPAGTVLVGSRDPAHIADDVYLAANAPTGIDTFLELAENERERLRLENAGDGRAPR
jgi:D-threo-aldose 1-dehydrogenase